MFKHYVAVYIVLLAVLHLNLSSQDSDIGTILTTFMEGRCGKETYHQLASSTLELRTCLIHTLVEHEVSTLEDYFRLFCTDMRDKFHSCLVTVLQNLKSCLHTEEKYIPDFISGWYNNTFEEECNNENIEIIVYLSGMISEGCTALDTETAPLVKCFSKSSVIKDVQTQNFIITKSNLCRYLEHGIECLLDFLKEHSCNEYYEFLKIISRGLKISCNINDINDNIKKSIVNE